MTLDAAALLATMGYDEVAMPVWRDADDQWTYPAPSVLLLALAVAVLCATAVGWRHLISDRRLRSSSGWRDVSWGVRVFLMVAVLLGVAGGVWLGTAVQEGKEARNERDR